MTTDTIRALLLEMADELDHRSQCLLDDRRLTHPLADRARTALAAKADGPAVPEGREPASVVGEPSEEELLEEGPSLEEVEELCEEHCFNVEGYESIECLQGLINDALARWGHPAPVPVAVSERPWEREGWCDDEGRCWCMSSLDGPPPRWWLVRPEPLSDGWVLPAHALPLPQGEAQP